MHIFCVCSFTTCVNWSYRCQNIFEDFSISSFSYINLLSYIFMICCLGNTKCYYNFFVMEWSIYYYIMTLSVSSNFLCSEFCLSILIKPLLLFFEGKKPTMRYHFTLVRMAIINKSTTDKCWGSFREKGTLVHCWWNAVWCSHCGKQHGISSENYEWNCFLTWWFRCWDYTLRTLKHQSKRTYAPQCS